MRLPEYCYSFGASGQIIKIYRGETCGYGVRTYDGADELNRSIGVSRQKAAAMHGGLTHGWETPYADPANYSSDGVFARGDLIGNE